MPVTTALVGILCFILLQFLADLGLPVPTGPLVILVIVAILISSIIGAQSQRGEFISGRVLLSRFDLRQMTWQERLWGLGVLSFVSAIFGWYEPAVFGYLHYQRLGYPDLVNLDLILGSVLLPLALISLYMYLRVSSSRRRNPKPIALRLGKEIKMVTPS